MKLIDVDKLEVIDSHIHYIKIYKGSAIFLDNRANICRFEVKFSIEYKPIGDPEIKIQFIDKPDFMQDASVLDKVKRKITELDDKGVLSDVLKKTR